MGQKMGQKNPKGSVSIIKDAGRIRLRWRYQSKRYSLNLFNYNKTNLLQARKVAVTIEQDMVIGAFDNSLEKYSPNKAVGELKPKSIPQSFIEWVRNYKNREVDDDVDYSLTKKMLERWGSFSLFEAIKLLSQEKLSPRTYNARLRILRNFYSWGLKTTLFDSNPFEDVTSRKGNKTTKKDRKPFTFEEIQLISQV